MRIIILGDIEIEKCKFHHHKNPVSIDNVDLVKILSGKVSSKENIINILLVTNMTIKKLSHYT